MERPGLSPTVGDITDLFRARFGRRPDGVWQAPGRVNLIGDHTDYNAGLALPFAIDRQVVVAAAGRDDGRARCWSAHQEDQVEADIAALLPASASTSGWGAYPFGVIWALREAGVSLGGVDLAVMSTVPVGGGLSSSAALTAGVAAALDGLGSAGLSRRRLAELCRRAEADFVGAPVGMLDPLAVLYGQEDRCLLIDFRDLAVEMVPMPVGPLVVVDTGVRHHVRDGRYRQRRQQCQAAAAELGVPDLRHANLAEVEARLDGVLRRRARHVVNENERVRAAAQRLRRGDDIGELLWASHASLRDDFEVSCPELDAVVEAARAAGARGARLTGAGFGGCAIVVGVELDDLRAALARVAFTEAGAPFEVARFEVAPFEVAASDGARRIA